MQQSGYQRTVSRAVLWSSAAIAVLVLWQTLLLNLLPALLAGLLVYELVNTLTGLLRGWLSGKRARWLVVTLLAVVVVGLLILAIVGAVSFLRSETGDPALIAKRFMPVIDRARQQLPHWIVDHMPDSSEDMRQSAMDWLGSHAAELQLAGKEAARVFAQIVIGLILGALVALNAARPAQQSGPLARALIRRCARLAEAFHNIVFAQVKIALINTLLTALLLLVALPLFGIQVPLAKTLVGITFVVGLLPVVGNLISNSLIVVVSLSVSLWAGVAALAFLIAIHKLEYFLNARIIGTQIRSRAWELLLAMLVMEAAFGLAGLVAAPIYYAYLKSELEAEDLI